MGFHIFQVGNPPDVTFLPSNFFAKNLLATLSLASESGDRNILCGNCNSADPAQTRCIQCNRYLCQFCTDSHGRFRDTSDHIPKSLNELRAGGPSIIADTVRCLKHKDEVIKLYCTTCETTICRDCTIVDHRKHSFSFVEDVATEKKNELLKLLEKVKERKTEISNGITNISEREESVSARNESTVAEINKYFDNLAKILDIRKNELIEKATLTKDSKHKQLQAQREQLEITLASCESNIKFTEQAFKNGNDVQLLNVKKYISQSLESLKNKENQIHPAVDDHIEFTTDFSVNDLDDKVALSCFVVDRSVSADKYTARFNESQKWLKVGTISKITIEHKTFRFAPLRSFGSVTVKKNGSHDATDESQRGLETIKPVFRGVTVKDVTVSANKNGSHDVGFIPLQVGVLKFEAYINGRPAPSCTLSRGVKLTLHSKGERADSTWFGECILESGIHTWKITINHDKCSWDERADFEIGVINYDDNKDKHVLSGYTKNESQISLTLDMSKKKLTITPSWGRKSSVYDITFPRVSPYFTLDCSECNVKITEMGPFSFEGF